MDDNDKIRRNLVVFSSSVLYAGFVGVSVKEKTISLFTDSIKISLPDAHVLWFSSLVLVLYFLLRLIQSEEFERDWAKVKENYYAFKFRQILNMLGREITLGQPKSFLDTGSIPAAPDNGISLPNISKFVFENKDLMAKVFIDSAHAYPQNSNPVTARILLTFEFQQNTDQSNTKHQIIKAFPGAKETQDFHYFCTENGDIMIRTVFEYSRNIFFRLSNTSNLITSLKVCTKLICKTKFGTVYCVPFLVSALAVPACIIRFYVTYFT